MKTTRAINDFLLANGIRIRSNPAISPDLCLDPAALEGAARAALPVLKGLVRGAKDEPRAHDASGRGRSPRLLPGLRARRRTLALLRRRGPRERRRRPPRGRRRRAAGARGGRAGRGLPAPAAAVGRAGRAQEPRPEARPGEHGLPGGAGNPGSIEPGDRRPLHDAPLAGSGLGDARSSASRSRRTRTRSRGSWSTTSTRCSRTASRRCPFPFIGGSVPEGHQGQSVEGMSHASILAFLKIGFHRRRIPWGFNADHQPIGGRFDAIEEELAQGCAFASYITFDLSPELALHAPIEDPAELERAFATLGEPELFRRVVARLGPLGLSLDETQCQRLFTYLLPAMRKLVRRRRGLRAGAPRALHRGGGPAVLPGAVDRRAAGPHDAGDAGALPRDGRGARRRDPLRRAGDRLPEELPLSRQLRAAAHGRRSLPGGAGLRGLDRVPLGERQVGGELPRRR